MADTSTDNEFPPRHNRHSSLNLAQVIYTYEGQWIYLCGNVSSFANLTESVEELVAENDETR